MPERLKNRLDIARARSNLPLTLGGHMTRWNWILQISQWKRVILFYSAVDLKVGVHGELRRDDNSLVAAGQVDLHGKGGFDDQHLGSFNLCFIPLVGITASRLL